MCYLFFFLMIRRPPMLTQSRSSAASDVYKRQYLNLAFPFVGSDAGVGERRGLDAAHDGAEGVVLALSLIYISEPTRLLSISYAVFSLKKKNKNTLQAEIENLHQSYTCTYMM